MKNIRLIALVMLIAVFTAAFAVYAVDSVDVKLVYPQASRAPKRELPKKESPATVRGAIIVSVTGIKPEQLNSPDLAVEYFMDDTLVYSAEAGEGRTGQVLLKYTLDTTQYPDGRHALVVNLWDKGSSAIGIRDITIKNGPEE